MTYRVTACRSCVQPIIWTRTRLGKAMPVDAAPSPDGTFILAGGDDDEPDALYDGRRLGQDKYTSHFATCPNASKHRKEKTHGSGTGTDGGNNRVG